MGLLKFGLCVITWLILCVSKTSAEYKSIANNGTRCIDGQDITQTDPCIKCVCIHATTLCRNVPCEKNKRNAARSGPDTKLLKEKARTPDLTNRRRLPNKNDAIQTNYQKPHMSSFYTKDSKVIEERRPNVSMILTQTREENILNTFLPQSQNSDGSNDVNNDDNYILIVPDEESDKNSQAQTGQSVSPFELPPGVPRSLARQPFVFGRPGDKRLLMRPRHFMRINLKKGKNRYSQQRDSLSSNVNANWKNKLNQQRMFYPQNSKGNSGISVYTPSHSTPFRQSEYYYPKKPIIYTDKKTNSKHFVDGQVRWKPANDYPENLMPQNNKGDIPKDKDGIWNQAPGGKYPSGDFTGGKYPGDKFPGGKYPIGMYPGGKYPGGNYPIGKYPNVQKPGINFPGGKYPGGKYPGGNYPVGKYPNGQYPGINFPEGKYPDGMFPDGKYPGGTYPDGKNADINYSGGSYPGGKYPVGKYPDGNYPDASLPGAGYTNGNNPGGGYPNGNNPGTTYPGGNNPAGDYPVGEKPDGSNFDLSNPLSNLENNNDLSLPEVYPEKAETPTVNYIQYKWQKKQRRIKKKQKNMLALDETPFDFPNEYPPNESLSQVVNKKKKIIKKKRKIRKKKKKQMMLYLDDDDDKKPTYDENYPNPESDSSSYPDDKYPTGSNLPTTPDYQLPGNLQPFRPNQNGFIPDQNQKNPINLDVIPPPTNSLDYSMYPGQDKGIDYKKHKLHKKKTLGLYDEPESPTNIPNYVSPQNKFPRPQAPDQNLQPPMSNYQPFQPKTSYSDFSAQMSKKKRKRKKKKSKNKSMMIDIPDPDYPEITPEFVKLIKNNLLPTQQTPNPDYSLITPELAKKIKQVLLNIQKTPYPQPLLNKPQRPKHLEMYPDYEPDYPNMPKKPDNKNLFHPITLDTKPENNPDYDTNPMMYDYPHITEKPQNPVNYPNYGDLPDAKSVSDNQQIPVMYDEIKPKAVQTLNSKPKLPVDESPIMPVINNNIPEKYPGYPSAQVSEQPIVPLGIYPNNAQPKPNKYNNIPNVDEIESSIIPQNLDSELQMYPGYKPKPKQPLVDNKPNIYPDYEPAPIIPQNSMALNEEPQMYPNYKPQPVANQYPGKPSPVTYDTGPELYDDDTPTSFQKPQTYQPQRPLVEKPIRPVSLDSEPEMYPDFNPEPPRPAAERPVMPVSLGSEPQKYPDLNPEPMPEKPSVPEPYNIEPEIYIDDTPEPLLNEYPPENPSPVTYDSEPQMYPDNEPASMILNKPRNPVIDEAMISQGFDNKLQMYPDYKSVAQQPVDNIPPSPVNDIGPEMIIDDTPTPTDDYDQPNPAGSIGPVTYDHVPEIYPADGTAFLPVNGAPESFNNEPNPNYEHIPVSNDYSNPSPVNDIGPEMNIDDTPTPTDEYDQPNPAGSIAPVTYDHVPEIYPADGAAFLPVNDAPESFNNEPNPNNELIPVSNDYTNPSPVNDIGPEMNIDDTPTPTDEYNQPNPASSIAPVTYDHVPQINPADGTAFLPVNGAPESFNNEPNPNNEHIPVFNYYNNLPEYDKPQINTVPHVLEINNENPEMYPDTSIPVFNNYADLNKKPPNDNPQIYTPAPPTNMPFTEVIPLFNSYPDLNKNPSNPQISPNYLDYSVPLNPPKAPDYGRPQLPQPMFKPKIQKLNNIFDIKMMKPNSSPQPKFLPFKLPQSEEYLLQLKKKRISKMKHNNVRPTISMPYIGEGMENVLDLSRFTDDMTYTQTHLKKNMCKLCQILDCIHPKRQDNSLFPAIKILIEENELSGVIEKMLSKMRQFNSKYLQVPFSQEFEIMMPPAVHQNRDIFNQFKTGTDIVMPGSGFFDEGPPFMPFMPYQFERPNSHGSEMAIFNKFKSFKGKSHKKIFDGGMMKPHYSMFPSAMPFMPKPFNFGSGLPNFNNFIPFPTTKFSNPLSMMPSLPIPGISMSMAKPTLSMPMPIPSVHNW